MEGLNIRPVTEDNWRAIVELKPLTDQKKYITSNAESLLESFYETRYNWSVFGLFKEEYPIGFTMIGAFNAEKEYIWLDRFMIDGQFQGKGYGKKFLQLIVDYIQLKWQVKDIVLSIVKENNQAKKLYETIGFIDTGRIDEENGELVMVLNVKK
ncbi:diamine N-acetyltransferase [Marinilactibacillus piezotolerans]|uniref:Diamine N-acetyltransferase n=1 Tax=Marinilactibacillus piezotolerans TaxID=258723 RepID=A0A1I3XAY3_9LACT|nr:GNAT family N-acetyltransferase [Marinilactibacillus piezotolerans]SFK16778.1 diamine N-acetyltransferase [Marinilactibacillus piezotolerans]